jgi:hypothetical protein
MENDTTTTVKTEPRLRHEFVGMMFAIAIGEVGSQVATLFKAGHFLHNLPAYAHLLVATMMIATSWVGWSVSRTRGARLDVTAIFQWEFVVLLLDVSMVIIYFIMVRAFEFDKKINAPRLDHPSSLAFLIACIFGLYILWDIVTKVAIPQENPDDAWLQQYGRMIPTIACLTIVLVVRERIRSADTPHYLTADFALLSLVFLFRALKDLISAFTKRPHSPGKTKCAICWTAACLAGVLVGTLATTYSWNCVIPDRVTQEVLSTPPASGDIP